MEKIKNFYRTDIVSAVVLTLIAVILLVAVPIMWWMPFSFGYPLYALLVNIGATGAVSLFGWAVYRVVND